MFRFQGYKPDVEICKFMFRYILKHCQISAKQQKDFSTDYKVGFISAVCEILKEAKREKDEERAGGSQGERAGALVIRKMDAVSRHYGDPNYGTGSIKTNVDSSSYNRGKEDGSRMDVLRRGVGHSAAPAPKAIR